MTMYLGLDVHSKQTVYVAQDAEGKIVGRGAVPTTRPGLERMTRDLAAGPGTTAGLESGTQSRWVARELERLGVEPVVINAAEVRAKARRPNQKSDRRDAFEICDGLRRGIYTAIVYVPPNAIERLRLILSRRRHFVALSTGQINAAKFVARQQGLSHRTPQTLTTEAAWRRWMDDPALDALRPTIAFHAETWMLVRRHVKALEADLAQAIKPFAAVARRLRTMPGVGPLVSATFIAVVGDPHRFKTSNLLASYVGLVPSTYDSGQSERHGRITKRGSTLLRAALCEAAQHAARVKHPFYPYYARVAARQGHKRAITAVAHRLARVLHQMWVHERDFDTHKLNVRAVNKQRTRRVYYEIKRAA